MKWWKILNWINWNFEELKKRFEKHIFLKMQTKKRKQIEFRNFIRSESIYIIHIIYLWDEQFEAFLRYSDVMVIFPSIFGFSFICLNYYGFDWNEMSEHFAYLSLIRRLWSISTVPPNYSRSPGAPGHCMENSLKCIVFPLRLQMQFQLK